MILTFKNLVFTICLALLLVTPSWAIEPDHIQNSVQQARTAGVSDHLLNRILTAGYSYNVSSRHMIQWLNMMKQAAEHDIPQEPLADKLEEGLSKRIEVARINAVLEKQLEHLQWADQQLQYQFNRQHKNYSVAVTRIADLMMTGLSKQEITSIIHATPAPELNSSLNGLTFYTVLNQADIPADNSQKIVVSGMKKGVFSEFPVELAFLVKAAHSNHIPREDIIRETEMVLNSQQSLEQMQHNLNLESVQHPTGVSGQNRSRNRHRQGAGQNGSGSGSGNSGGHGGGSSGSGHGGGRNGSGRHGGR